MQENEQLIIDASIKGERISQTKLYNRYAPKMLVVCLRYANNRQEAEDILQEGFIRVFTYLETFKGAGSFEGWIRKIMVNCALERYRKKIHLTPVVEFRIEHETGIDPQNIITDLSAKELLKLIQGLSPRYRLIFNLYVFEGLKHLEIAKFLGIAEGTSKSNLSDARKILQSALKKRDSNPEYKKIIYG